MALLHRQFDVVRVIIATPNNDEILEAPGYENVLPFDEAQVARAQKRIGALVRQGRAKSLRRLLGPVPVACGNSGTRHPQPSPLSRSTRLTALRIDDDHHCVIDKFSAAGVPPFTGLRASTSGDQQRCFSKSVTRMEGRSEERRVGKECRSRWS